MRAEIKKVWQERGLASLFLNLRLVHGELNIMVQVVQSWVMIARWLYQMTVVSTQQPPTIQ